MVGETPEVPTPEHPPEGSYTPIFEYQGGWYYRDDNGTRHGPFINNIKAKASYEAFRASRKPQGFLHTDQEIIRKVCDVLGINCPPFDQLEKFVIEFQVGQYVRVIPTLLAKE